MGLPETLRRLSEHHLAALSERDRRDFADELDRLRMLRVAEDGLGVGDYLPDFALSDGSGRMWTSSELLDRGPLVLALFRGDWCPYCELTMAALERARPALEALGATAVGVMPDLPSLVAETARRRGLRYLLLSDPANRYARACGLSYDLSPAHIRIHRDRGRDFPARHGDDTWRLPVPAVFVAGSDARVAYAFSDADPAGWPNPDDLLAALATLGDTNALSTR